MAFDAVFPLRLTTERLLESSRISIETRSRQLVECAEYGANAAIEVVEFLVRMSDSHGSASRKVLGVDTTKIFDLGTLKAMERKMREAASGLEYVIDSHVSEQFVLQSERIQLARDEGQPLLYSLDLRRIEQDIVDFTLKMRKLEKLFNLWGKEEDDDEEEDDEDEEEDYYYDGGEEDGYYYYYEGEDEESSTFTGGSRIKLIHSYASKAASRFMGIKEEYIQELDTLLHKEEGEDYYYDGDVHNDEIMIWWANKAASVFVTDMESDSAKELEEKEEEEDEKDDSFVSSRTEFVENMVGLTDMFCDIRDSLFNDSQEFRCTTIFGMAGIGKTALAMKILEDPLISSTFERRLCLRIGQEYDLHKIGQAILAQLNLDSDKIRIEEDGDLNENLYKNSKDRKILVVLDDVWDPQLLFHLKFELPREEVCGCRFLMTTRLQNVATDDAGYTVYAMRFLNNKESWDLLQGKVFTGEACPRELEKAGKQIAENCEGLPLLIITVAELLSKAEKTLEYWTKVAASKKNSIFIDAYEKISEVLYPSYSNLPQHLKTCFLYLGAFPQNCDVRISKLINLWSAEGFGGGNSYKFLREIGVYYFEHLVSDSVALDTKRTSFFHRLKSCSLHSVFWYLSKKEAWNENFLHVLDSYADASVQDIESRPRLSVYKNSIFSVKDVCQSIASIPGVRSLLCTGLYHPYQVPVCFGLRLLKVLDALSIRFYDFPPEVVKLLLLRYLALTCNGNLSPSISKLWSLQCLIVHQHLCINSSISESYLPVEIWDLLELQHLQIIGRNLPEPPHGVALKNLLILLDVGAHTCTKRVFESIPNLDKLRVRIELMPEAAEPLCFFDEICLLKELSSLHCVIVNPDFMSEPAVLAPLAFASNLTKLRLSGFGYPWKDMQIIAELPNLQVLKLRCYAFRGEEWQVEETKFQSLKYFSIEDTDLVEWAAGSKNFPVLEHLTINNCYKLQDIPRISSVREIRVVDCNPSAVTRAKQRAPDSCSFHVEFSWLDSGNLKS